MEKYMLPRNEANVFGLLMSNGGGDAGLAQFVWSFMTANSSKALVSSCTFLRILGRYVKEENTMRKIRDFIVSHIGDFPFYDPRDFERQVDWRGNGPLTPGIPDC